MTPIALLASLPAFTLGCQSPAEGAPVPNEGGVDAPRMALATPAGSASDQTPAFVDQAPDIQLVVDALLTGDLDAAKAGLDGLLVERALGRANTALTADNPADALTSIDELLDARHPDGVRLKAEASLLLAEQTIAAGGNGLMIQGALDDARKYFDRVRPGTVKTFMGASRAAWLLSDAATSADRARSALDLLEEDADADEVTTTIALQQLAQSSYGAYVQLKQNEGDEPTTRLRFDATETALSSLLGTTPDDAWVWTTLSDLYEWEGMNADARAISERGLERLPQQEALWDRLGRVARKAGGRSEAVAALDAVSGNVPDTALGHWYRGWERIELAIDQMHADTDSSDEFRAAEIAFARTAELDEARAEQARGYQVICRAGVGWCAYYRSDWKAAEDAFKSMNELFDGGIAWDITDRVGSGVLGLSIVVAKLAEENRFAEAGKLSAELYELTGSAGAERDPLHANNAGFFLRDAAVEAELLAQRLCDLARGDAAAVSARARLLEHAQLEDTVDAGDLRAASAELLETAHTQMRESARMYLAAAAGMPDDVRVVNDAALVHIYYLYENLAWSEEQLLRMVEVGERQMADETLEEDARWELANAWGDAYQNLGVLWATHKNSPADALPWFERCVEIGPEPRPAVTNLWIPFVKGELEPDASFAPLANANWGAACAE